MEYSLEEEEVSINLLVKNLKATESWGFIGGWWKATAHLQLGSYMISIF